MQGSNLNIAILSPLYEAYSETFIQAHKRRLAGNIFYYSGSLENIYLEGEGKLTKTQKKFYYKLKRKILNLPYSWYYEELLKNSFKEFKIDVVLAEYGPTANKYLSVVEKLGLPLIVHFHGYDASRNHVIKENDFYKDVFRYSKYVISVSQKMSNDLRAIGCSENKIVYNPYGPSEEFYKVKPQFSRKRFVALGRFVDKKAPYYTILAFNKALKKFPDAELVMGGEGPLFNMCKNLTKVLGIESHVKFPGIITSVDFCQLLSNSLAFVQHSITAEDGDSEGTPVAILEASAAGIPVISTRHAGIPDVIADGQTGLLIDEHDVNGMADKMSLLLGDLPLAMNLGKFGRQRISSNFSIDRHISVLNKILCTASLEDKNV